MDFSVVSQKPLNCIGYEVEIQKLLFKRSCLSCSWMTPHIVSGVYETLLKLNLRWRIFQWLLLILLNTIYQKSSWNHQYIILLKWICNPWMFID